MRYGILGGGFGMYGYLPAIAGLDSARIATLEKYREIIRRRPELADFERRISFVGSPHSLLEQCDTLVIAQRPADQEKIVNAALSGGWDGIFVLEKPLAHTPAAAEAMLAKLAAAKTRFIIGFTLSETDWAKKFTADFRLQEPDSIHFDWRFLAHHYDRDLTNWKRHVSEGGGALRFYAVHLLALLAQLDDWSAVNCSANVSDEDAALTCSIQTAACRAEIHCDSRWCGRPMFNVTVKKKNEVLFEHRSSDPFSNSNDTTANQPGSRDSRIECLQKLLGRVASGSFPKPDEYKNHLRLWRDLEDLRSSNI